MSREVECRGCWTTFDAEKPLLAALHFDCQLRAARELEAPAVYGIDVGEP